MNWGELRGGWYTALAEFDPQKVTSFEFGFHINAAQAYLATILPPGLTPKLNEETLSPVASVLGDYSLTILKDALDRYPLRVSSVLIDRADIDVDHPTAKFSPGRQATLEELSTAINAGSTDILWAETPVAVVSNVEPGMDGSDYLVKVVYRATPTPYAHDTSDEAEPELDASWHGLMLDHALAAVALKLKLLDHHQLYTHRVNAALAALGLINQGSGK